MKPADGWLTPTGAVLQFLGEPPAEPVLQIFRDGECVEKLVLRAADRTWLRQRMAPFDPLPAPAEPKPVILAKLAAVADAYEQNGLDEARPEEEHTPREREKIVLLAGRGGKTLLTLADAFAAREALRAAPAPALDDDNTDGAPVGPIMPGIYQLTHGPLSPDIVEIRFQHSWRPRHVQSSTELGFAVEGITGWFRHSDEGKSWRWPQSTME